MTVFLLVVLGVIFVSWLVRRSISSQSPMFSGGTMDVYTLLQQGVQASGVLVWVGTQRTLWGTANPGYYEVRKVALTVEIPGQPPYQNECSIYVPASLRRLIIPGATLELRVDPGSPTNIAVYGPGVGLPFF